jgi:hypothetical protein
MGAAETVMMRERESAEVRGRDWAGLQGEGAEDGEGDKGEGVTDQAVRCFSRSVGWGWG